MSKKVFRSFVLVSSLCCYSLALQADFDVTVPVDVPNGMIMGTLSWAIAQANMAGGGIINVQTNVTLAGNPVIISPSGNLTINGGGNSINGVNTYEALFVNQGTVTINDLTIQNTKAQGGVGGNAGMGAGGGAGGLGAGGALFVNSSAVVTLSDVHFSGNNATGGAGGTGGNLAGGQVGGGGGGGGGGFSMRQGSAQNSDGGVGGNVVLVADSAGGGGGGGGSLGPPLLGPIKAGSPNSGTTGGDGGDGERNSFGAGSPATGGFGGNNAPGGNPVGGTSGGGGGAGGGGVSSPATSGEPGGTGGNGFAFSGGGGGGGGSGSSIASIGSGGVGGLGGFGGGGGGAGTSNTSGTDLVAGGMGGFGGGGAGSGDGVSIATSVFGGGQGGQGFTSDGGGGGAAGLGGAIFVRNGGQLTLAYTSLFSGTAFALNTAVGGIGAGTHPNKNGSAFGQDIFLMSGGDLSFTIDAGITITIPSLIQADNLAPGGGLILAGPGTLILTGGSSNGFTGGTVIEGSGTLQVPSDSALGISTGPIVFDVGTLQITSSFSSARPIFLQGNAIIDTLGNNLTLTGTVFGNVSFNGSLTKTNAGILTLTSQNSYVGGTILNGGVLSISSDGNLGDPSGDLTLSSATLQITSGLSSDRFIHITGNPTIDTQANVLTLSGFIDGGGTITKQGSGTLLFSGLSNATVAAVVATGAFTVNGSFLGNVQVTPGAFLKGNGRVGPVTNLGTVAPGNSIDHLSILGSYTQSSVGTLEIEIDSFGNTDLLTVSGLASLDGVLSVIPGPGPYLKGITYTILEAGSRTGEFSTLSVATPGLHLGVLYPGNNVELLVLDNFLFVGQTIDEHNPREVATYLQGLTYSDGTDLFNVIQELGLLTGGDLVEALDRLQPSLFGAFDLVNVNATSFVATLFVRHQAERYNRVREPDCTWSGWNGWLEPFGYFMDQHGREQQKGFDVEAGGVLGGLEYSFENNYLLGLGGGYSYAHVDWSDSFGSGSIQTGYVGIYSDYVRGPLYVDVTALFGINGIEGSRHIKYPGVNRSAHDHHAGYSFTAHAESAFDLEWCCNFFTPFVKADYVYFFQDKFREHGAQSLNLHVSSKHSQMLRSEAGVSFERSVRVNEGSFTPRVWISYVNEFFISQEGYTASLVNEPGSFTVRNFKKPYNFVSPGIDFSWLLDEGLALSLGYSAELSHIATAQKVNVRFGWEF